jgi:hypothetical protein
MELTNIKTLSEHSHFSLNPEEYSYLDAAMIKLKIAEKLAGKIYFWGKICGMIQDYLIVVIISNKFEIPTKKFYFWYSFCVQQLLSLLF